VPSLASALVGNKCTAKVNHYADGAFRGRARLQHCRIIFQPACALKPFRRNHEIILKRWTFTGGTLMQRGGIKRGDPMLEFIAAFFAAFGASIFLAHAVEAYLSR
jgi:hypothetical protein